MGRFATHYYFEHDAVILHQNYQLLFVTNMKNEQTGHGFGYSSPVSSYQLNSAGLSREILGTTALARQGHTANTFQRINEMFYV